MKTPGGSTDRLMEESERLRADLVRLSSRVCSFTEQLREEVRDLRERTGETEIVRRDLDHDRHERGNATGDTGPTRPTDQLGDGAER